VTDSPWDETLYQGSAAFYTQGRLPYPLALADALQSALNLRGEGRLLDVGCGPGSLTLLLAPLFQEAIGIDPDADMLAEANREAEARNVINVSWRRMRAEDLPDDLGTFRVVTFAQSFHWMDQPRVARAVTGMLEPDGVWVHVSATTHRGIDSDERLPLPSPPRQEIKQLVERYLGDVRRAGRRTLPGGTPSTEEEVMAEAEYTGPLRLVVPRGEVFERTADEIVASVYSLSWAAPHLFGQERRAFEADLRRVLQDASPSGRFCEQARDIELVIWRRPTEPSHGRTPGRS
jgi:SAM-dependent methyltransferase